MAAKDYDHLFKLLIIGEFSSHMSHRLKQAEQSSGHWTLTTASEHDNNFTFPGDSGVGKSSLLVRFADNHFSGNYITTIGTAS